MCCSTILELTLSLIIFSWPCLHQWLETRPNRQVCPVCKAAINREKVVPLYGRGGTNQQDPREKHPPRPAGQRTEPEPGSNFPGKHSVIHNTKFYNTHHINTFYLFVLYILFSFQALDLVTMVFTCRLVSEHSHLDFSRQHSTLESKGQVRLPVAHNSTWKNSSCPKYFSGWQYCS